MLRTKVYMSQTQRSTCDKIAPIWLHCDCVDAVFGKSITAHLCIVCIMQRQCCFGSLVGTPSLSGCAVEGHRRADGTRLMMLNCYFAKAVLHHLHFQPPGAFPSGVSADCCIAVLQVAHFILRSLLSKHHPSGNPKKTPRLMQLLFLIACARARWA